jgi:hypothetical protein
MAIADVLLWAALIFLAAPSSGHAEPGPLEARDTRVASLETIDAIDTRHHLVRVALGGDPAWRPMRIELLETAQAARRDRASVCVTIDMASGRVEGLIPAKPGTECRVTPPKVKSGPAK